MIVFFFNLIALCAVFIGFQVPFNDAARAVSDGILSATSVIGYSVTKSLWLYGLYLACAVGAGLYLYVKQRQQLGDTLWPEDAVQYPVVIQKREWAILSGIVFVVVIGNIFLRERVFTAGSLHSEEFYNLAAASDIISGTGASVAYPYAIGHLFFVNLSQWLGVPMIVYKFIFNAAALVLLYRVTAQYLKKVSSRFFAFGAMCLLYLQPILEPSFHRNIGRFFTPVFFMVALYTIAERRPKHWWSSIIALVMAHAALLLFGSADGIVIGYVIYLIWTACLHAEKRLTPAHIYSPFIAAMSLLLCFGRSTIPLMLGQLQSIVLYSGHANATPFFDVTQMPQWQQVGALVKYGVSAMIYYVPIGIMFQLIVYLMWQYKRSRLSVSSSYVHAVCLTVAFTLSFRQNFGDAGIGRIGIAGAPLFFIIYLLRAQPPRGLPLFIRRLALVFFAVLSLVNIHALYGSAKDSVRAMAIERTALRQGYTLCPHTAIGERIRQAGFIYCEKNALQSLEALSLAVDGEPVYIFDDTFSLYYILGAKPIVLIPTYYASHALQRDILHKLQVRGVQYIIEPVDHHFFGVSAASIADPRWMSLIRSFMVEHGREVTSTPEYTIIRIHE